MRGVLKPGEQVLREERDDRPSQRKQARLALGLLLLLLLLLLLIPPGTRVIIAHAPFAGLGRSAHSSPDAWLPDGTLSDFIRAAEPRLFVATTTTSIEPKGSQSEDGADNLMSTASNRRYTRTKYSY